MLDSSRILFITHQHRYKQTHIIFVNHRCMSQLTNTRSKGSYSWYTCSNTAGYRWSQTSSGNLICTVGLKLANQDQNRLQWGQQKSPGDSSRNKCNPHFHHLRTGSRWQGWPRQQAQRSQCPRWQGPIPRKNLRSRIARPPSAAVVKARVNCSCVDLDPDIEQ